MAEKPGVEAVVREIKRRTRRKYASEGLSPAGDFPAVGAVPLASGRRQFPQNPQRTREDQVHLKRLRNQQASVTGPPTSVVAAIFDVDSPQCGARQGGIQHVEVHSMGREPNPERRI
jgi:hypothetical protein